MQKGMQIDFDDEGDPKIDGVGFTRNDKGLCKKISDWLAAAMGGKGIKVELKPEYVAETAGKLRE
jgi:hypothetical protein